MNKLLAAAAAALTIATPVLADPVVKGWKTYDSMGCMLLQECTDDVVPIKHVEDLQDAFPDVDYGPVYLEATELLASLDDLDVEVFLADDKYFPTMHRGTYHTISNKFYLNKSFMSDPVAFIQVMRHEGWHVLQDCMAGTIDNTFMAVVHPEEDVPEFFRDMAERTYTDESAGAVPWEQEALWAGWTENMTVRGLRACAAGKPWEHFEPTAKTYIWLFENGFIDKD